MFRGNATTEQVDGERTMSDEPRIPGELEKARLKRPRTYEAPVLRHLGSVRELTLAGTGVGPDPNGGALPKANPGHGGGGRRT